MAGLENERLGLAFANRPDIINGIQQAAGMCCAVLERRTTSIDRARPSTTDTPERIALFNNITTYVIDQYLSPEPSAKRRRIDATATTQQNGTSVEGADQRGMLALPQGAASRTNNPQTGPPKADSKLLINMANAAAEEVVLLEVKEVSVSIPQRKKYDLCFTKNYLYTKQVGTPTPVQGMVYKWEEIGMSFSPPPGPPPPPSHIFRVPKDTIIANTKGPAAEYVFYVPIPEKQQLQHNYILFPRSTALSATKSFPPVDFEPFLFTVPPTAPKPGVVAGYAAATAAQVSDSYTSLMHWAITSQLLAVGNTGVTITAPDARVFHSNAKQAYRPNERAVHVKAHRGTKDGFLFFLPNGILWGYKKPLLFIPLDRIVAVSYTNVLQRTFDITIEVDVSHAPHQQVEEQDGEGGGVKTEEIEFSMIDHEDYGVIDDSYIQRHGLNNRSMAEGRRAKRQLRESGGAGAGAKQQPAVNENGDAVDPEEAAMVAALDRAEEMLEQDEEDEEEEDYDPGSEGESEGEGSSSEEESDEDGDEDDGDEEDEDDGGEEVEGDEMEVEGGVDDQ